MLRKGLVLRYILLGTKGPEIFEAVIGGMSLSLYITYKTAEK